MQKGLGTRLVTSKLGYKMKIMHLVAKAPQ